MAIISIPTSIGGVSIPGLATKGPLGALFGNIFGRTDLQYPRDLQSATRGHVIQFQIEEIDPAHYEDVKKFALDSLGSVGDTFNAAANKGSEIKDSIGQNGLVETFKNQGLKAFDALKNTAVSAGDLLSGNTGVSSILNLTNPRTKNVGTISLYIPDNINFQYGANYDSSMTLMDAASQISGPMGLSLIGKAAGLISQTLNSGPAKLIGRGLGYAFNPQQMVLFQGIDFRPFTMSFTFTPYSRQEADDVAKIIKLFKVHSAPRNANGGAGMFFIPPSQFKVKFLFNGRENTKISKIATCVIENIDVNYTPNGFATTSDGSPVQTTLNISFKEIELITREKIEQGY
jgi:hypothetical protein